MFGLLIENKLIYMVLSVSVSLSPLLSPILSFSTPSLSFPPLPLLSLSPPLSPSTPPLPFSLSLSSLSLALCLSPSFSPPFCPSLYLSLPLSLYLSLSPPPSLPSVHQPDREREPVPQPGERVSLGLRAAEGRRGARRAPRPRHLPHAPGLRPHGDAG